MQKLPFSISTLTEKSTNYTYLITKYFPNIPHECLPAFLQTTEESLRVKVLLQLPKHLQALFPLFDVSEWIAKNWRYLTVPILKLAEKLCS
jgi:hypothetical protein